jgi:hypothetical protein
LRPNQHYAYRVGDGFTWSEWIQIRTAKEGNAPFSFIYLGDAQNKIHSLWSRTIREAFRSAPDASFVLHAGDLVDDGDDDAQWGEWFQAGGWIHSSIPLVATPGNHEYPRSSRLETLLAGRAERERHLTPLWRSHFALPENGPAGLEESSFFMDCQGMRLISLNSNENIEGQTGWLRTVLSSNTNRMTVAFFHHPVYPYSTNCISTAIQENWVPLFDEYGIDLVLCGHEHCYSRTRKMKSGEVVNNHQPGTVYATSVSGPKMHHPEESHPSFARSVLDTQLFQVVRVDQDRLEYIAKSCSGEVLDHFSILKQDGGSALEEDAAGLQMLEMQFTDSRLQSEVPDKNPQLSIVGH